MDFGEVMVALVGMGCGTGIVIYFLDTIKSIRIARHNASRADPALLETMRQMREEMSQLRHSTNDVVLTFDSTLQRLDHRLQGVEHVVSAPSGVSEPLPGPAPRLAPASRAEKREVVSLGG